MVRNSIILVDFVVLRLRQGMPFDEAVVDAGAVRFRPMLLTAAAVVVGSAVILFDPIFQGLAVSLMAGEVASLFLSRMAVPVLCYVSLRKQWEKGELCLRGKVPAPGMVCPVDVLEPAAEEAPPATEAESEMPPGDEPREEGGERDAE